MLYIATLTQKTKPDNSFMKFGTFEAMQAHADRNSDNFDCEVGPAHQHEIEAGIADLEKQAACVRLQERNSSWASGPAWREKESAIAAELALLKKHIRKEGSHPLEAA